MGTNQRPRVVGRALAVVAGSRVEVQVAEKL